MTKDVAERKKWKKPEMSRLGTLKDVSAQRAGNSQGPNLKT